MIFNLENKVAIVTGASSGLGKAIASSLAGEGVRVVISGRNRDALAQAAVEIESETGKSTLL